MGLFSRSDRTFREREPRIKPQGAGGSRPPFKYYPPGSTAGFPLGSFADDSRVGQQFQADFGVKPSECPIGWHPALQR